MAAPRLSKVEILICAEEFAHFAVESGRITTGIIASSALAR